MFVTLLDWEWSESMRKGKDLGLVAFRLIWCRLWFYYSCQLDLDSMYICNLSICELAFGHSCDGWIGWHRCVYKVNGMKLSKSLLIITCVLGLLMQCDTSWCDIDCIHDIMIFRGLGTMQTQLTNLYSGGWVPRLYDTWINLVPCRSWLLRKNNLLSMYIDIWFGIWYAFLKIKLITYSYYMCNMLWWLRWHWITLVRWLTIWMNRCWFTLVYSC